MAKAIPKKNPQILLDTRVEEYAKFKKLQRYQELQGRKDSTDQEKDLLKRLKEDKDIQSFLPKNGNSTDNQNK